MTSVEAVQRATSSNSPPKIALVHDFLVSRGGAERVALSMARAFPEAVIHTALHNAGATFDGFGSHQIKPLPIDKIGWFRNHHRASLPLLQTSFSRRVIEADVVLCSSSGFSHNVTTTGRKIIYCHTPARWLHDQERYLDRFGPLARGAARWLSRSSLRRDGQAMIVADRILANSSVIRDQIRDAYGREASVVPPCSSLSLEESSTPIDGIEPGFVFCPSRALGYKRLDVLLEAARRLPQHQFVQVGDGPDLARLRAEAPSNVRLLGDVTDGEVRWGYENASVVALTSAEDFGLVPLEATAHGVMSAVPHARGFLDHVVDGENGWFYEFGDADGLAAVISDGHHVRAEIPADDALGEERFAAALQQIVQEVLAS